MSVHHHMNYLSPYARGLAHGIFYGFSGTLVGVLVGWMFLK